MGHLRHNPQGTAAAVLAGLKACATRKSMHLRFLNL